VIKIAGGSGPDPLLLAATVWSPPVNVKCVFKEKCKGVTITKRDTGIQFLSTKNGEEKQIHWGCLACGRKQLLRHLNNLSRCQGWIVDALNKASQTEYAITKQRKNWERDKKFVKVADRDESE